MKFSKKLTAAAAIVAAGFASNAAADTATDTIEVYAGLAPALELTCTDVHFGVWRVPTGDRGGVTTVALTAGAFSSGAFETTAAATGFADRVALSKNAAFDEPQVGTCVVTGSTAAENAPGSASIIDEDGVQAFGSVVAIGTAGDYEFGTIGVPANEEAQMSYLLELNNRAPVFDANGRTEFAVEGTLTIPQTITAGDLGGYKSNASHTVAFNDGVVED